MATAVSSSSTSMGTLATPLTSPSFTTSPTCASNVATVKDTTDPILTFQSDPSLPALLSSTSSVLSPIWKGTSLEIRVMSAKTAPLSTQLTRSPHRLLARSLSLVSLSRLTSQA